MASLQLRLRPKPTIHHLRLFSSAADPPPPPLPQDDAPPSPEPDLQSKFNDIKSRLKQQTQQPSSPRVSSLEEIRKNLSEFRRRSTSESTQSPPPPQQSQPQQMSFQELYKRNVANNWGSGDGGGVGGAGSGQKSGKFTYDAIRDSLRKVRENAPKGNEGRGPQPFSFSALKDGLRLRSEGNADVGRGNTVIGGTSELPASIFGKELRNEKEEDGEKDPAMKNKFLRTYNYEELGEKLRKLRPGGVGRKKGGWFSLGELNERLVKLREIEEKEAELKMSSVTKDLRASLRKAMVDNKEKKPTSGVQRISILSQLTGSPDFMLQPPKEHLVEKYYHPDNMSAAEKLKIELAKVREEFKMSESDCGSARVQVAQLTTKIKYLSPRLHKKDKHSRKGLIAMVQQRKKLLKYLRRTDWESYCFVLDKLGLRDSNADVKSYAT